MFNFFSSFVDKLVSLMAGIAISVGLVSVPEPSPEIPTPVVEEIKVEEPQVVQQEPPKIVQKAKPVVIPKPEVKNEPILALPEQKVEVQPRQKQEVKKELRIKGSTSEIWATGRHYANFSFDYLVDGKPTDARVTLKNIYPSLPIPGAWQAGILTKNSESFGSKTFIFSTDIPDTYTLEFTTEGVSSKIFITAKKWGEWQVEGVPVRKETSYTLKSPDGALPNPLLVGSFKFKANPDSTFRITQCSLTADKSFGAYEFRGGLTAEYNSAFSTTTKDFVSECSNKGGYFRTDESGLSEEIQLLVDTQFATKFYLKDFVIADFDTKKVYNATTTLFFKLDIIKEFL